MACVVCPSTRMAVRSVNFLHSLTTGIYATSRCTTSQKHKLIQPIYPHDTMTPVPTKFTSRPKRKLNWRITQTNGVLSLINNWHKNEFGQKDVDFVCSADANRKDHEALWEAVPKSERFLNNQRGHFYSFVS